MSFPADQEPRTVTPLPTLETIQTGEQPVDAALLFVHCQNNEAVIDTCNSIVGLLARRKIRTYPSSHSHGFLINPNSAYDGPAEDLHHLLSSHEMALVPEIQASILERAATSWRRSIDVKSAISEVTNPREAALGITALLGLQQTKKLKVRRFTKRFALTAGF